MIQKNLSEAAPEISAEKAEQPDAPAPRVSIVVPVYKVEKYLRECVESVLAQTFKNFECILVDDGSPDGSGAICDKFAARDKRVRAFHQPNGGVSSARKLGVERSRGEWIMFLDSDDVLAPAALETLLRFADSETDLVEGSVLRFSRDEKTGAKKYRSEFSPAVLSEIKRAGKIEVDGISYGKLFARAKVVFCRGPYPKIVRRALFAKTHALDVSREIVYGEDTLMNMRLSTRIRRAVRIPDDIYFYRENPDGVCAGAGARWNNLASTLKWWSAARECFAGEPEEFGEIWKTFARSTFGNAWLGQRDFSARIPETREWLALLSGHWSELPLNAKFAWLGTKFPLLLIPEKLLKIFVKILFRGIAVRGKIMRLLKR